MKFAGFGAAQLLPNLAYHMKTDFAEFEAIFDDDSSKVGLTFPSIQCCIQSSKTKSNLQEYGILVTAVDSSRSIIARISELGARFILTPSHII